MGVEETRRGRRLIDKPATKAIVSALAALPGASGSGAHVRFSPALEPSGERTLCTEAVDIAVPINGKQGRRKVRLLSERLGKRAESLRGRSILTLRCQASAR